MIYGNILVLYAIILAFVHFCVYILSNQEHQVEYQLILLICN